MINRELLDPKSIVVIGGSNDIHKPGGKVLKHLVDHKFIGELYVVNPKDNKIQGIDSYSNVSQLPEVELAILSIPAAICPETVEILASQKKTKAFIILSAGFGEAGEHGVELERQIVNTVNKYSACLIGPNCIGVLNSNYAGVFTSPVPPLNKSGCDLISSSGATAVFLMEAGIPLGLKFSTVISVGNGAQTGIEEVLEYMDEHFDPEKDARIKLLYMESVKNPAKLLRHATSLIRKGAKIAAIKAGTTEAGSRAAASHTGALSNSDVMVRALFRKAGIVYCSSREELLSVASIFNYKELTGKNIAIITHAGGSAVMLTDALSSGGLEVPAIEGEKAEKLLKFLHPGSSVGNPIDFLATGTAEQLGIIIDYCEYKFDHIDAMIVVFGSPGLFDVENVYNVLSVKLDVCTKPIYPVLPSVINARKEISGFLDKGHINFPDEVTLGRALSSIYNTPKPNIQSEIEFKDIDEKTIRTIISECKNGFLHPDRVSQLLDAVGIHRAKEFVIDNETDLQNSLTSISFPLVMKVVGPVHKSDVNGVLLNVGDLSSAKDYFGQLMNIKGSTGVLVQEMLKGDELFIGATRDKHFGHLILCGLGGIFIEVLNDFAAGLVPVNEKEASQMIRSLKGYKLFEGIRGKQGIDETKFNELIRRVDILLQLAPEIAELDLNPLLGNSTSITAVDSRIRIEKN